MRTGLAAVVLGVGMSVLFSPLRSGGREALAEPPMPSAPSLPPAPASPAAVAEAMFRLGQSDEDKGAFAQALLDHRASVAAAPESEWAQRAADRIAWLKARSEGDFGPLARLERVRRSPALASDPAALEALARDAASFPPGQVRTEARMLVAEAWLGRLQGPPYRPHTEEAMALLRAVSDDTSDAAGADPSTARLAERELVDALVGQGRLDEAAAEARAHADRLDPRFVKQTQALVRRRTLRTAAIVELGAFALLAGVALLRAKARGVASDAGRAVRRGAPVAVAFVAYLGAMGGVLASFYERGNAAPFVLFGLSVLPLLFLARSWAAVGSTRAAARAGRAVLCAVSVLAAAFLLLDGVNPTYLDGFGL
jgi:hypothetical protein